jgi:hypothetical protein
MTNTERVQVEINAAIEADAREFGLHDRQGPWRLGLLVARNVEKGKQHGVNYAYRDEDVSCETSSYLPEKVSAGEFAMLAGTSKKRVLNYLKAWDKAADEGWVPHSSELSPAQEVPKLLVDRLPEWSKFYIANPKRKEVGVQPIAPGRPQKADLEAWDAEPASEADIGMWCRVESAPEFIERIEISMMEILGDPYTLNATDLGRLEAILRAALERIENYEPLTAKKSKKTVEHQGERKTV